MRAPNAFSLGLDWWRRLRGATCYLRADATGGKSNSKAAAVSTPWQSANFFGDMSTKSSTENSVCPSESAQPTPLCQTKSDDTGDDPNYEHMTLDEFAIGYPTEALNPRKRPTFWPHRAEDQLLPASAADATGRKYDH